jgi:hypothetical protein
MDPRQNPQLMFWITQCSAVYVPDPCDFVTDPDPDPALFLSDLHDGNKNFLLITF